MRNRGQRKPSFIITGLPIPLAFDDAFRAQLAVYSITIRSTVAPSTPLRSNVQLEPAAARADVP